MKSDINIVNKLFLVSSYMKAMVLLPIYYAFYAIRNRTTRMFDDSFYERKRVIVIGPAETALNYLPGPEIDAFDIIVRINKSAASLDSLTKKIGTRTDVLYHCCYEDPKTGGGPIPMLKLRAQRNSAVIYTYHEVTTEHNFYRASCKYPELPLYRTPKNLYKQLKTTYKARMPTTGLQALNHILQSNFSELHITGFTFFRTPYTEGYRDSHKTGREATLLAKSSGNHDPDDELRLFLELLEKHKSKLVILDSALSSIVEQAARSDKERY